MLTVVVIGVVDSPRPKFYWDMDGRAALTLITCRCYFHS